MRRVLFSLLIMLCCHTAGYADVVGERHYIKEINTKLGLFDQNGFDATADDTWYWASNDNVLYIVHDGKVVCCYEDLRAKGFDIAEEAHVFSAKEQGSDRVAEVYFYIGEEPTSTAVTLAIKLVGDKYKITFKSDK